jgi:hypothetical protein
MMAIRIRSWRVWGSALLLLLGLTTMALAQHAGKGGTNPPAPTTMEFTQQEVLANSLVETLNEMGKQHWDIFQVVPIWKFQDQGGGAEMTPIRYQILGRRAKAEEK